METQRGYTLVELTAAMAIAAAATLGMVAGGAHAVSQWRLEHALYDVATSLRAARAQALVRGEEVAMPLDVPGRRYTILPVEPVSRPPRSWVARLPPGVRFARPDSPAAPAVTLNRPGTSETAAVYSPRGLLLSDELPGYVHLGVPERGLWGRLRVGKVGGVAVQRWDGSRWR